MLFIMLFNPVYQMVIYIKNPMQRQAHIFNPPVNLKWYTEGGTIRSDWWQLSLWGWLSFPQKVTSCLAPVHCTLPQHIRGPCPPNLLLHTHICTNTHWHESLTLLAPCCDGGQDLACYRGSGVVEKAKAGRKERKCKNSPKQIKTLSLTD